MKKQINQLKKGDKLIFIRNGGVLSADIGNVFTFSNWKMSDRKLGKRYWQSVELLMFGENEHCFSIFDVELFDEKVHTNFTIVNEEVLKKDEELFVKEFGS